MIMNTLSSQVRVRKMEQESTTDDILGFQDYEELLL